MSNDKINSAYHLDDNTISETYLEDLQAILDEINSTYQFKANEVNAEAKTLVEEVNAYKAMNADKAIPIELVEHMKDVRRKSYCIFESINKYVDSIETVLQEETKLEEDMGTKYVEDASDFESDEEDIEEEDEDLDEKR